MLGYDEPFRPEIVEDAQTFRLEFAGIERLVPHFHLRSVPSDQSLDQSLVEDLLQEVGE